MNKLKLIGVCAAVFAVLSNANTVWGSLPTEHNSTEEQENTKEGSTAVLAEHEQQSAPEIPQAPDLETVLHQRYGSSFEYPDMTAKFPMELGFVSNLSQISFPDDIIPRNFIPATLHFTGLFRSLKILDLSDGMLTRFPTNLGELENLEDLSVGSNRLSVLPKANEIEGKFLHLKCLDISRNELEEFPIVFGKLPELCYLDVSFNTLLSVPSYPIFNKIKYLFFKTGIKNEIMRGDNNAFAKWLTDNNIDENTKTIDEGIDELPQGNMNEEERQKQTETYIKDRIASTFEAAKTNQQIAPAHFEGLFPKLVGIDMSQTWQFSFPRYLLHIRSLQCVDLSDNFIMPTNDVHSETLNVKGLYHQSSEIKLIGRRIVKPMKYVLDLLHNGGDFAAVRANQDASLWWIEYAFRLALFSSSKNIYELAKIFLIKSM